MKIKALVLLLQLLLIFPVTALAQKKTQTKDAAAPLIPLKDFFRNPTKVAYSLSPNGEYLKPFRVLPCDGSVSGQAHWWESREGNE